MRKLTSFIQVTTFSIFVFSSSLSFADSNKQKLCGSPVSILTSADFDGSGVVDKKDIKLIKKVLKRKLYYAFYDINADGKFNEKDVKAAKQHLGTASSSVDREMAKLFHQVKQFGIVDSTIELNAMGQVLFADSLAGHGQHWINLVGRDAAAGRGISKFYRPEGLNIPEKGNQVAGLFWAQAAIPVFANGATDYPTPGGAWMVSRVVAFSGSPPKFTSSASELWHTHAGLCFTADISTGKEVIILNQHTSFMECQILPTSRKLGKTSSGTPINPWINVWMLHVWMFDLNPNGIFANTHPCLDPNAPSENVINRGRVVPPFFLHHGG